MAHAIPAASHGCTGKRDVEVGCRWIACRQSEFNSIFGEIPVIYAWEYVKYLYSDIYTGCMPKEKTSRSRRGRSLGRVSRLYGKEQSKAEKFAAALAFNRTQRVQYRRGLGFQRGMYIGEDRGHILGLHSDAL